MHKLLCSTGALIGIPNDRNYRLLESLAKELQCDGFEFMMYSSWYDEVEDLIKYLKELKLYIPVVHCEKRIGEGITKGGEDELEAYRRFEINCRLAKEIGAIKLVLHLWNGTISDSNFSNNLKAYAHLQEIAIRYGLDLLIENVVCNVYNPMKHWLELKEKYSDIHFVFDTKMAAFHNEMDLLYDMIWLWKDKHIQHYHVNDYAGGYMDWKNLKVLPIGKGNIDFDKFFNFINSIGYEGDFTVESTAFNKEGVVDIDMLNSQFDIIRDRLKK